MPKYRGPSNLRAQDYGQLRAQLNVPSTLATQLADAWQVLTAAIRLTVRYGGEPMAWVIASVVEAPDTEFYRRIVAITEGSAAEENAYAELLKHGEVLERRIRAAWKDERAAWQWLFFARPGELRGYTPFEALRFGEVARLEQILTSMEEPTDP